MAEIVTRTPSRAHLEPGGAGWRVNGSAFSNPAGKLNLVTSPAASYLVTQEAPAQRNKITVLPNGLILLATVAVDPFVDTTVNLLTVPSGLNFQAKALHVRCTAAVGITSPASAGAGIAGGTEVYQDQAMSGLDAAGLVYRFPTGGASVILTAGQVFAFTVSAPPTGTSQTLEVQAYGRLFV